MTVNPLDRYTCEEAVRRLDDYVDRELSESETRLVNAHLETCAACAQHFQFEEAMLSELKQKVRRIDAPADLLGRIRERLRDEPDPRG